MNRSKRWRWVVGVLVSLAAHGTAATVLHPRSGPRGEVVSLDRSLTIQWVRSRTAMARTRRLEAEVPQPAGGSDPRAPHAELPATTAKEIREVAVIPKNSGRPRRAEVAVPQPGESTRSDAGAPLDEPATREQAPVPAQVVLEVPRSTGSAVEALADRTVARAVLAVPPASVVQKPKFRSRPSPPRYPPRARQRQQEGVVVLDALVGIQGRAREVLVWSSSGFPLLDEAAQEAMAQWEFEPAERAGEFLESWVRVPVHFALR